MYELSASIELLFTEAGDDPCDRVRAAASSGFGLVEMWMPSGKNLDQLGAALSENGVTLLTMLVEPRCQLGSTDDHASFVAAVESSAAEARRLGCPFVVTDSGRGEPWRTRAVQHESVVKALRAAADAAAGQGVTLLLENVNTRVDHPGTLLDTATECIEVVREVDSPNVRMLYDLYHSVVAGEVPATVLKGAIDVVAHVQVADHPGRGEPGSGTVDWPRQLRSLRELGYEGVIGLEYRPTTPTAASLKLISDLVATA